MRFISYAFSKNFLHSIFVVVLFLLFKLRNAQKQNENLLINYLSAYQILTHFTCTINKKLKQLRLELNEKF